MSSSGRRLAAFILTHGRPDNVKTLNMLHRQGWEHDVYLICDDEDEALPQYEANYPGMVVTFHKQKYVELSDTGDAGGTNGVVLFARNACWDIAKQLGVTHFWELDDDYTYLAYRYEQGGVLRGKETKRLSDIVGALCDYLDEAPVDCVALAQMGDLIGGIGNGGWRKGWRQKVMNTFVFRTDRPVMFCGRLNEDVNTYVTYGNRGSVMLSVMRVAVNQGTTQANAGGLTDAYLSMGTYQKSFYSVMMAPSSVKISAMGDGHDRLHHMVDGGRTYPRILREEWRRERL